MFTARWRVGGVLCSGGDPDGGGKKRTGHMKRVLGQELCRNRLRRDGHSYPKRRNGREPKRVGQFRHGEWKDEFQGKRREGQNGDCHGKDGRIRGRAGKFLTMELEREEPNRGDAEGVGRKRLSRWWQPPPPRRKKEEPGGSKIEGKGLCPGFGRSKRPGLSLGGVRRKYFNG